MALYNVQILPSVILDLSKTTVDPSLSGGSEPVISEGEVAIATLKEERTGAARQNESDALGVLLKSSKRKDLAGIPKNDVKRIMDRIKSLGSNPRPAWSKKLSGREEYRARQGNYRILYVIEEQIKIVQVTKVGHRRNIYQ